MKIDLVIHAEHLYTMQGEGLGYKQAYSLACDRGKIIAIAPRDIITAAYEGEITLDNPRMLVLPGFIDAHMHSSHAVYRGVAQDVSNWMMEGIGPFSAVADLEAGAAGSRLAITEAMLNGTTTIGDDGRNMEAALAFIDETGLRGNVSIRIRDAVERLYTAGELYEFAPHLAAETL
ncbi:MAG: amidohydrolase family protein, partial [Symbiobacteriaceae bacterium]|nr:amidohydrolase family protein [Symbiobacteriaceae bacterium]